jgi:hypothetical protein
LLVSNLVFLKALWAVMSWVYVSEGKLGRESSTARPVLVQFRISKNPCDKQGTSLRDAGRVNRGSCWVHTARRIHSLNADTP